MEELLTKFENKRPEIVFEWKDSETEAEGWVVINSLRGGAAGGGTRMRKGLDKREVESLAKTMEVKFTVSGPAIGGAKSGINFDPADPRKKDVLKRWYKAVVPLLKNYYGTGGDLNIDEIHEVIPITESFGLLHPQEGVVNGHFNSSVAVKQQQILQLQRGVSKVLDDVNFSPNLNRKYVVADMITGYGVAQAVKHFYTLHGTAIAGKRAVIQGWGNVAAAAAWYLAKDGVKVTGIIDRAGGIVTAEGLTFSEIDKLFEQKTGNTLVADNCLSFEEANKTIWSVGAEIFIPAAASRLVTQEQVEMLLNAGLEVISCGSNVPFADKEIFFGPIGKYTDSKVSLISDFIANCGMARVFAYLMKPGTIVTDEAIFEDTSAIIGNAIKAIFEKNNTKVNIAKTGFEIALHQLV